MEKTKEMIQVCKEEDCDKKPAKFFLNGEDMKKTFCCAKGLDKMLKEFEDFINKPKH